MAVKKKEDKDRIKPLMYEMTIEALIDNDEETRDNKMLRVCGVVTHSNFMPIGNRFCAPLVYEAVRKRFYIGDKVRITNFCKNSDINNTPERIQFVASGQRYEVWDDTTDGWTCVYDKYERDGN